RVANSARFTRSGSPLSAIGFGNGSIVCASAQQAISSISAATRIELIGFIRFNGFIGFIGFAYLTMNLRTYCTSEPNEPSEPDEPNEPLLSLESNQRARDAPRFPVRVGAAEGGLRRVRGGGNAAPPRADRGRAVRRNPKIRICR